MRRSVRFLIAAAAFVALGGFADPAHNFEVAFPNGWSEPRTDTDGNVQSDAPGSPSTGWCRANSHRMTSLDGGSQETLNATYPAPLDAATWASVLNLDPAKITAASDGEVRSFAGHNVQVVTLTLAPGVVGTGETRMRIASHILIGRMTNVGCLAPTDTFDQMLPLFETVLRSLRPL